MNKEDLRLSLLRELSMKNYSVGNLMVLISSFSRKRKTLSLDEVKEIVQKHVCESFSVTPEELKTKSRKRRAVVPRQVAMTLMNKSGVTLDASGGYFGRDHSTAHHAIMQVRDLAQTDPDFRERVSQIENNINYEFLELLG